MEKEERRDTEWHMCSSCKTILPLEEMRRNVWVCSYCGYHERISALEYLSYLYNGEDYIKMFENILPANPLKFTDTKNYEERIIEAQKKTGLTEAIIITVGNIGPHEIVVGCMDFNFIGGSMGSVVGERVARAFEYGAKSRIPVVMVMRSGGARMMESTYSLMQMAKTLAALGKLREKGIPYIAVLTDPTTGGVTASYGMMGDITLAEKGALIGFAGPRVIRETTKIELPEGFQTAEYLLSHGFVDIVIDRRELRNLIKNLLDYLLDGK